MKKPDVESWAVMVTCGLRLWGWLDVLPNSLKCHWRQNYDREINFQFSGNKLCWTFLQSACQLHTPSKLDIVFTCCVSIFVQYISRVNVLMCASCMEMFLLLFVHQSGFLEIWLFSVFVLIYFRTSFPSGLWVRRRGLMTPVGHSWALPGSYLCGWTETRR